MNIISKFKIIPMTAAIALGIALTPALSMAGEKEHSSSRNQYSHDAGKSGNKVHHKEQRVIQGLGQRAMNSRSHDGAIKRYYGKPHVEHGRRVYYTNSPYGHRHHGPRDVEYIVVDHDYYDHHDHHEHYVDYDDVRLSIGVHTGNFDIVFRE